MNRFDTLSLKNNMLIKLIEQEADWEELVGQFEEANFLQSWAWGEFHQSLGKLVFRVAVFDEQGSAKGLAQAVLEPAKRGAYLAVAGGPLVKWPDQEVLKLIFEQLKELGRTHGCLFIRFRPQIITSPDKLQTLGTMGAMLSPMHLTADLTLQLDLNLSDEELLAQMRKNHRSAIRKADQLGIVTSVTTDVDQIQEFYDHQLELAKRHGFVPFGFEFLRNQFQVFASRQAVALIHARTAQEELLASAFVIFYNQEAVYHYGVSTDANRSLPGSYACQWRAMMEARLRGCIRYNFWGVVPLDQPHHRFAGVSLFKRGFGGQEVEYIKAHDIPLSPRYWVTWWFEKLRKRIRRL
ncbi:MAG: peptidoglycan bridge formation glycyltransferase FemA/FemB family protein [Patescibacteria group bacterium]